eukprot:1240259-Alexandrium_andersonii.AAC.1
MAAMRCAAVLRTRTVGRSDGRGMRCRRRASGAASGIGGRTASGLERRVSSQQRKPSSVRCDAGWGGAVGASMCRPPGTPTTRGAGGG